MRSKRAASLIWPLALLLLAAALRFDGAATIGLWSDEGWNWWVVHETTPATILDRLTANHHPPAYFLSLGGWRALAGESRLALRYPALLAGVLCVALLFRAGLDAGGLFVGIAAAAIFAAFEQPVYYGQTVRHYGYLALGVSASLLLFMRVLRRPSGRRLAAYALSVAFTLYSMYIGAFALAIQGLYGLFVWRAPARFKARLIAAWAGAGLLLLPWALYALPAQWTKVERGIITGYHNSFPTTPAAIPTMIALLLGGAAALGIGLLALLFAPANRETPHERRARGFIMASSLGLFALLLVVNLRFGILAERTLFVVAPAVALGLGLGLGRLEGRARWALLIALIAWAALTPQGVVPRINADAVAAQVAPGFSPDDLVILETGFDDAAYQYEMRVALAAATGFDAGALKIFRSFWEYDFASDAAMQDALNLAIGEASRVWVVYWNVPPRLDAWLTDGGFSAQARWETPAGENDPLYALYPTVTTTLYAHPGRRAGDGPFEPRQFDDWLMLRRALIDPTVYAGRALHVDLWWRPARAPEREYSVGVFLLDAAGRTRAEHIGPAGAAMTDWEAGALQFDRHTLLLPRDLPAGRYQVIANVYWYETPDAPLIVDGAPYAVIGEVEVR